MSAPAPSRARRVVVADDSRLMRRMLVDALKRRGFDVVGEAGDGDEALKQCRAHRPDALTLDLAMPGLDGMGVLRALRSDARDLAVPVVVVSAFSPSQGVRAVDALAEGAFDLVPKPAIGEPFDVFATALGEKVEAAADSGMSRARLRGARRPAPAPRVARRPSHPRPATPARAAAPATGGRVVLIACSTGGPKALARLVPQLPSPLGAGGYIVQHMPPGFTGSLAARLSAASKINVREAADGDALDPRWLYMAPGGSHIHVGQDRRAKLTDEPVEGGLCPRADLTIVDAARLFGPRLLLVVLTGMGKDGLMGAEEVRRHGGTILAEHESTCTVYGMPRAVVEAGLADEVLPLDELPAAIAREVTR